jgi:hypothetical protein
MGFGLRLEAFHDDFDDFEGIGAGEGVEVRRQPAGEREVPDGGSAFAHCDRRE